MSSGGNTDDIDAEFYTTIEAQIDILNEEITELAVRPDDDPHDDVTLRVIAAKQRTVDHLRGFLRIQR